MDRIDESKLEFPQLRVETVTLLRLGAFWNNLLLTGHHWRLYHHDKEGAAILVDGHLVEMRSDRIYLLPPYCNVRSRCKGDPVQLFIHFQATGFSGNPDHRCNELPMTPELERLLKAMYTELRRDNASSRCSLTAIALAVTAMVDLPPEAVTEMTSDRGIEQLCDRMRHSPAEPWSIKMLARIAQIPEQALMRRFREVTGSTPCQYLQHLRCARAARLLQSTDLSIEAICEYIGVNDRFHFSRRFKKIYGAPPVAYRKRYR